MDAPVIALRPRCGFAECAASPCTLISSATAPLWPCTGAHIVGSATITSFGRSPRDSAHLRKPRAPSIPPASSEMEPTTTRFGRGRRPAARAVSSTAIITPSEALVSTAPRPYTRPSAMRPSKGSPSQCSTVTVSVCTSSTTHRSSVPSQIPYTFGRPSVTSTSSTVSAPMSRKNPASACASRVSPGSPARGPACNGLTLGIWTSLLTHEARCSLRWVMRGSLAHCGKRWGIYMTRVMSGQQV